MNWKRFLAVFVIFCMISGFSVQVEAAGNKNQKAMKAYGVFLQKVEYAQGGFFVVDINKDGIKELFVTKKLDSSDFMMKYHHYSKVEVYTYTKGKLKRLKNLQIGVYNFKYSKKLKCLAIDLNAADREVIEIYKLKKARIFSELF